MFVSRCSSDAFRYPGGCDCCRRKQDPYDNAVTPGGGQSERSEWLPKVSQWAGIGALPMRAHWRTIMFFGKDRKLYKCPVYTWGTSLETAPVTGSLLFVAPGCRLSDLSAGEFVMRVSRVSANLFLCGVCRAPRTVFWDHHKAEMAMGSDSPAVSRSGVDFQVQLQVSWNAPEAYINLDSAAPTS